jgi:hypothetical protein
MMMQAPDQYFPNHFGIDHLFFLRMAGDPSKNEFEMTKELHLSQCIILMLIHCTNIIAAAGYRLIVSGM